MYAQLRVVETIICIDVTFAKQNCIAKRIRCAGADLAKPDVLGSWSGDAEYAYLVIAKTHGRSVTVCIRYYLSLRLLVYAISRIRVDVDTIGWQGL